MTYLNINEISELSRKIRQNPASAELLAERGLAYLRASLYVEALADFNSSIDLDPTNPYNFIDRGRVLLELNRELEARLDFDKALGLDPSNDEAYHSRAIGAFQKQRLQDAANDMEQAIRINGHNAGYFQFLARIYAALGRPSDSLVAISSAISLNPTNHQLYSFRVYLFVYHLVCDDKVSIMDDAARAIYLAGENSEVYFGRGLIHFAERRWEEAAKDFSSDYANKHITWDHLRSVVFLLLSRIRSGDCDRRVPEAELVLGSVAKPLDQLGVDSWPLQAIAILSSKISPGRILELLLADFGKDEQAVGWILFEYHFIMLMRKTKYDNSTKSIINNLNKYKKYCYIQIYFLIIKNVLADLTDKGDGTEKVDGDEWH